MGPPDMLQFLNTLSLTGLVMFGLGMLGAGLLIGYRVGMLVFQLRMKRWIPPLQERQSERAAAFCAAEVLAMGEVAGGDHAPTIH